MLAVGVTFVHGPALGAALVVAITVASLTLLPALLGFAGHRVERTPLAGLVAAGFAAVALVGVGLDIGALTAIARGPMSSCVRLANTRVALRRAHQPPRTTGSRRRPDGRLRSCRLG